MILFILKILLVFILFLAIELLAYKITETNWRDKIFSKFQFLDHQPWHCRICLQWWLNVGCAVVFLIATNWYVPTIIWLVLALLETAALKIEEKNNYINDEDYEDDAEHF